MLNKMPSISQFRQAVRHIQHTSRFIGLDDDNDPIYDKNKKLPIINIEGTVKIHGTNAGVTYDNGNIYSQSKNNVLSLNKDNAGFALFVDNNKDIFNTIMEYIIDYYYDIDINNYYITILGEWAGKGIQNGVAVSELEKSFYIFTIKLKHKNDIEPSFYLRTDIFNKSNLINLNKKNIYEIHQFKTFNIEVDFNEPMLSNNKIIDMTMEVEKECPVGKFFGISGTGEGIIFNFDDINGNRIMFKSKGEKHSGKSKIKKVKKIDNVKLQKLINFVDFLTPQWRLEQMYMETFDIINGGIPDIKKTGDYLRAVHKDIIKEESDLIKESEFTSKDLNSRISKIARDFLMERMDKDIMT